MNRNIIGIMLLCLIISLSCSFPLIASSADNIEDVSQDPTIAEPTPESVQSEVTEPVPQPSQISPPPSDEVILPEELEYLGAFRLPEASGGSSWEYGGTALTYYLDGDSGGTADGFPGSLFGAGHDQQLYVSEISIPQPIISKNIDDLNTATTLQEFHDITGGRITEALALPRLGLEYLPPMGSQTTGKLYFSIGEHFQDFVTSHGWSELDLSNPQPAGLWFFDSCSNYTSSDYIIEIPEEWAAAYTPGQRIASGMFREGVWGGRGPALFAYAPWNDGNPPPENATLSTVTPLLLYGIQDPGVPEIITDETMQMNGYLEADHWKGSAWLTSGEKSALIFVGTKAVGESWYGFPNGVLWDYACAEANPPNCPEVPEWPNDDRGFWAEDFIPQMIFFDPSDLAKVAQDQIESYEPQPYAALDISQYFYDPKINIENEKRDIVGSAAFDRSHGFLFVVERLVDEARSIIHVWKIE